MVYGTAVMCFLRFAVWYNVSCAPPSDTTLAAFVVFQSATCSFSTLKVYLAGIRNWVMAMGFEFKPWSQRFPVYSAMRGIKRLNFDKVSRKLAVTPGMLLGFYKILDMSDPNDVVMWAAMLVAFFGLFRKDNISVGKEAAFNPRANLTRSDFIWHMNQLWVRVRHSKTNQFHQRCHWVPLLPIPGHPMCPVVAVMKAFAMYPEGDPKGPAFIWQEAGQTGPLRHNHFVTKFKWLVAQLGMDWSRYSGHSFRRGGAVFCFSIGACPDLVKALGDWTSNAYQVYDECTTARRLALPRAMSQAIAKI